MYTPVPRLLGPGTKDSVGHASGTDVVDLDWIKNKTHSCKSMTIRTISVALDIRYDQKGGRLRHSCWQFESLATLTAMVWLVGQIYTMQRKKEKIKKEKKIGENRKAAGRKGGNEKLVTARIYSEEMRNATFISMSGQFVKPFITWLKCRETIEGVACYAEVRHDRPKCWETTEERAKATEMFWDFVYGKPAMPMNYKRHPKLCKTHTTVWHSANAPWQTWMT